MQQFCLLTEQICCTNSHSPMLKLFPASQSDRGLACEVLCWLNKQARGQAGQDSLQNAGLWNDGHGRLQSATISVCFYVRIGLLVALSMTVCMEGYPGEVSYQPLFREC